MGIIFFLLFFSISNITYAQNITGVTTNYCVDNSTIMHITVIRNVEKNTTRTLEIPENCQFGCQNDECLNSPSSNWMFILYIIGGVLVAILIIWWLFR
jgi:hypothetical protein